ncbi:hypothetical protein [Sediminicola sp. 1XM1-17]|uniref:hypothetical protein n=1 Tax=Sediminicola sp. 1XM1-17 TaxID=3127702 RepID=UPI003078A56C
MSLNNDQLLNINNYLDFKDLYHLDLRMEIFDHMVESIEMKMSMGSTFSEAFELECKKWNPELKSYSSHWLGLVHSGPKLVMQKCVGTIKKLYLKSLFAALVVAVCLFVAESLFPLKANPAIINAFVGAGMFICVFLWVYWYIRIRKSPKQTSYGYFIKINTIGSVVSIFIFNPLVDTTFGYGSPISLGFGWIFLHAWIFVWTFLFAKIFRKHGATINFRLAP